MSNRDHLTSYALRERLQGLPERERRGELQDLGVGLLVLAFPALAVLAGLGLEALR